MMKKILSIILLGGCLCLTACDSFLDENPKSTRTSDNYYKTEAQARSAINDLYAKGASAEMSNANRYVGPTATIPGMLTGYFSNTYEGQEVVCKYSRLLTRQDHTNEISAYTQGIWRSDYSVINAANMAILKIPTINMDSDAANELIAEAKFFRAFNYFFLVKTFGDVPLLLTPTEDPNKVRPKRSPEADVYTQIETDLQDAIGGLPAKTFVANGHRISKYVAAMALADVYFHQGKYAEAKTYAKMVIDSPLQLVTNTDKGMGSAYNQLRSIDDLNEVVYSAEYDGNIRYSGKRPTYAFSNAANAVFGTYAVLTRVYGPNDLYLNIYKDNDLRIKPNQFFHWNYTNPQNGKTWTAVKNQVGCWYYYDEDALLNTGKGSKDWNIYRLAEAYLDYAESEAQVNGVTAEAATYLAKVQVRANLDGLTVDQIKTQFMALSKEAFIHACWTERLREFPLEYKIWDDCVRTSTFPMVSPTVKGVVTYVPLIGAKNAAGATFKKSDLHYPISLTELQRNPNLTQNEGYPTK